MLTQYPSSQRAVRMAATMLAIERASVILCKADATKHQGSMKGSRAGHKLRQRGQREPLSSASSIFVRSPRRAHHGTLTTVRSPEERPREVSPKPGVYETAPPTKLPTSLFTNTDEITPLPTPSSAPRQGKEEVDAQREGEEDEEAQGKHTNA